MEVFSIVKNVVTKRFHESDHRSHTSGDMLVSLAALHLYTPQKAVLIQL